MSTTGTRQHVDRFGMVGDLALSVRRMIKRAFLPLVGLCLVETLLLWFTGQNSTAAFAMLAVGTCVALASWKGQGKGLPLMPMMVAQTMLIYGLPIAIGHEFLTGYSEDYITKAGIELLVFLVCLTGFWRLGMTSIMPGRSLAYVLREFNKDGYKAIAKVGMVLIVCTTAYQLLQSLGLLDSFMNALPSGASSVVTTLVMSATVCGFFMMSMVVGSGEITKWSRGVFWLVLAFNCLIAASAFLLSTAGAMVIAVLIGLFWSTGKMPWVYLTVVIAILAFLNIGKFTMRDKYWRMDTNDPIPQLDLRQMPGTYVEWIQASAVQLSGPGDIPSGLNLNQEMMAKKKAAQGESLLNRVNNLENLLYVIDAEDAGHIEPMHGETYFIIPALLVPRILWPDKPRTHEGQVRLNVHFKRQDLESSYGTYIAWGLLPEAYGNFGPIFGSVFLGAMLGFLSAWVERLTQNKPMLSLEGLTSFALFLSLLNSYEMVASVLVTATFQSILTITMAFMPFMTRTDVINRSREQET